MTPDKDAEIAALKAEVARLKEFLLYVAENDIAYLKAPAQPPPHGYPGHFAGRARALLNQDKTNG